jgi:hypothetical protein
MINCSFKLDKTNDMVYNLDMDKLKVIIEEPSGSRRSFFYSVKSEEEARDIAEGIEKELKPNFSMASWKYTKDKDKK